MTDYSEFLNNPSLHATTASFVPIPEQKLTKEKNSGPTLKTGLIVQPNGDVFFRVIAPTASTVDVDVNKLAAKLHQAEVNFDRNILTAEGRDRKVDFRLHLEKGEDGVFTGLLPWNEKIAGFCNLKVFVDGVFVVEPHMPVHYTGNGYLNFVEIPDARFEDILIKDVPHGSVSIDVYWSEVMKRWVRQFVYLPPDYRFSDAHYPVVYLHQGRSESETGWVFSGKVPQIMDNLIAAGKAVPSIIVMNDGMYRTPEDGELKYDGFIEMICRDTIPYVEKNYRCIADKWHRALAGLSMGGMQACQGGLSHPELFAWLGFFSASIRPRDTELDYNNLPYLNILLDAPRAEREYKLIHRINGIGEVRRDIVVLDDEDWITAHGVDQLKCYQRDMIYESGGEHDWSTFRRAFHLFMQRAFKD